MDYKKLIKSRATRVKIMQLLSFVPDSWMLRLQYRIKTGRKLNLKNPRLCFVRLLSENIRKV